MSVIEKLSNAGLTEYLLINRETLGRVVELMHTYGGSFVKCLADCFDRADIHNIRKLLNAFPEYIREYDPERWEKDA